MIKTVTAEERRQAAETASEAQLNLYGSDESADTLSGILSSTGIADAELRGKIQESVANVSLGFYSPDDFYQQLTEDFAVAEPALTKLKEQFTSFFAPLGAGGGNVSASPKPESAAPPQPPTPPVPPPPAQAVTPPPPVSEPPKPTPQNIETSEAPKMRTMQADMNRSGMTPSTPEEPTFTSTQEAILKEGKGEGPKPTPKGIVPPPPPPRA